MPLRIKKFITFFLALACLGLAAGREGSPSIPKQIEQLLGENANFEFDHPRHWRTQLLRLLSDAYGHPHRTADIEETMVRFLFSDATYAAKKQIWMDLANIVTDRSLPTLIDLLGHEDHRVATLALLILQKADLDDREALTARLGQLSEPQTIAILHHFASNREQEALPLLHRFLESDEPKLSEAAFLALAKYGAPAAAKPLQEAFARMEQPAALPIYDAMLRCAEGLAKNGHKDQAARIYRSLAASNAPISVQTATMRGQFFLSSNPVKFVREKIAEVPTDLRPYAIRLVSDLPASYRSGIELLQLEVLTNADRAQLLLLLASRKDPSIRDYAMQALDGEDELLRQAALRALPSVVTPAEVDRLLERAIQAEKEEREQLVAALSAVPGKSVDEKLAASMDNASTNGLLVLLEVAEQRQVSGIADTLFDLAQGDVRKVRLEAIRALETVGGPSHLDRALDLLAKTDSSSLRRAWERAVYRLALKQPDDAKQSAPIVQRLRQASGEEDVSSYILILGEIANPADLDVIRPFLQHPSPRIQIRAAEALAKWPSSAPLDDLRKTFANSHEPKVRQAALRAALGLIEKDRDIWRPDKLEAFDALMKQAQNPAEEKLIIAAYGEVEDLESLRTLVSMMERHDRRTAAERAIREIMRNVYSDHPGQSRPLILRAKELSQNEGFREWIDEGLRHERFSR